MIEKNVVLAGGTSLTGLLLLFLLWLGSKLLEVLWDHLTRQGDGVPTSKDVAEVLSPKKSVLHNDVHSFLKAIEQKLRNKVQQMSK